MRKYTALILALAAALGLTGCSAADGENSPVILEKPPALTVVCGQAETDALPGSYSWQLENADGTTTNIIADGAHPLDCRDLLSPLETTEATAELSFLEEPDSIVNVQRWSDEHWSEPAADSEAVSVNGSTMELKSGGYIYEITAQWDTKNGYGGTAHYSVYIRAA